MIAPAPTKRDQVVLVVVGLCIALLLSLGYIYQPQVLRLLDGKVYDALFARAVADDAERPEATDPPLVVVVDIDDASLAHIGQWPWPRTTLARLLASARRLGASSLALDMILAESDRTSLCRIAGRLAVDMGESLNLDNLPADMLDNDVILGDELSRGPYVLGHRFYLDDAKPAAAPGCDLAPIDVIWSSRAGLESGSRFLFSANDVLCNLALFHDVAPAGGFVNVAPDVDGVIRRVPLVLEYDGEVYPSLALAALAQAGGADQIVARVEPGGLESVTVLGQTTPVDGKGNLLVRFPEDVRRRFDFIPAIDLLMGQVSRERIEGRIVIFGVSATGLADLKSTPLDPKMPGVAVHASVLDTIASGRFFTRPHWATGAEFALVIILGLSMALLLAFTGPTVSVALLALGGAGVWFGASWLMAARGIYLSPLIPLLSLIGNFASLSLLKSWREERRARRRAGDLARFQEATIEVLASVVETRDSYTGGHIVRTKEYVRRLALHMSRKPKFRNILTPEYIDTLVKTSPLHDIGKIGVPDMVLQKPGRLTEEEFVEMRRHPIHGRNLIRKARRRMGEETFLVVAEEVAYTHQEKWDGSGYPEQKTGEEIPLSGRIMALADVYDALISRRVYKEGMDHEKAADIIREGRGSHFDPDVVDAFNELEGEFQEIARRFSDDGALGRHGES